MRRSASSSRPFAASASARSLCCSRADSRRMRAIWMCAATRASSSFARERLDEVVVGPGFQTFDATLFAGPRRQQDDRKVARPRIRPQLLQESEAVESRHHHVGQDQVGRFAAGELERLDAVRRGFHAIPAAQEPRHVLAHVRVVVGDEDTRPARGGRVVQGLHPLRKLQAFGHRTGFVVRQPPQRLLDEGVGAGLRRGRGGDRRGLDLIRRKMSGAQRQHDAERGPVPDPAFGPDLSAVQLHELLDESQADAAAFVGPASRALDAMEPLEEAGHLLCRDSGARVADRELDRSRG